jgi:hypothetical protein
VPFVDLYQAGRLYLKAAMLCAIARRDRLPVEPIRFIAALFV